MEFIVIPKTKINTFRNIISNARSGFGKGVDLNPIEILNGDFIISKNVLTDNSLGQFTTLLNSQNPALFSIREVDRSEMIQGIE